MIALQWLWLYMLTLLPHWNKQNDLIIIRLTMQFFYWSFIITEPIEAWLGFHNFQYFACMCKQTSPNSRKIKLIRALLTLIMK